MSDQKSVRVYVNSTVDVDAPGFQVDMTIDAEGRRVGSQPLFGMQGFFGSAATQECYPFVLYRDGRVDFGTGYDERPNERRGHLDLLDEPIKEGRLITFSTPNYGEQTFRIFKIRPLPITTPE